MLKISIKTDAFEFCSKYLPDLLPESIINQDFNKDNWEIGTEEIPVLDKTGTILEINDELELSMHDLNPEQILLKKININVLLYYDEEETYSLYYYYRQLRDCCIHNIWNTHERMDINNIKLVCERVTIENKYVDFFAGIKYREKRPDQEDYDSGKPRKKYHGPFKISNSPFDSMIIKKTPETIPGPALCM